MPQIELSSAQRSELLFNIQGSGFLIIFRYLAKEVLVSMFAVSLVLLLIIVSGRFVGYLAEAAAGKLDAGVLLTLMAFRMPAYLELILPLGLFIGILMSYGRMYVDSEMTVLSACGMSQKRLITYTLLISSVVAIIVAVFSLYLGPQGVRASEKLLAEQRNRTDFEKLKPERFHAVNEGLGVSYAQSISSDKQQLRNVFMAELAGDNDTVAPTIVIAESGETMIDRDLGQKYLLLKNGLRYSGKPGEAEYEVVEFEEYAHLLPEPDYAVRPKKITDGLTTLDLMNVDTPEGDAALQWRLSLPLVVLVVALFAVPLSKTEPRKGRYGKLLPAIVLYLIYLVCVNAARGAIEDGKVSMDNFLWFVHFCFFVLGLFLASADSIRRALSSPSADPILVGSVGSNSANPKNGEAES